MCSYGGRAGERIANNAVDRSVTVLSPAERTAFGALHVAMGSAAGCVRWAAVLTTSWVLIAPPPQSIAWLGPHTIYHPSRRNHIFDTSSSRRRPCSADKPSRLPAPATSGRSLLGSAASDTQSPHSDLSAAAATTAASPPSPSLVPWHQARFSVTLPPPRGPDDRCRAVTKTVTNGLVPLLEGFTADEGVGLLHVLNSTASLAVSPIPPPTTVQEAAGTVGATAVSPSPPATAVALTIRDGSTVWGQGQELWMSLAQEEELSSGDGGGDNDTIAKVPRGSARYDFLVLWCAPQHGDGVSASGDVEATKIDGRLTPGIQNGAGGGDADRQSEAGVEGGERGQGRGMGPSGGHVVGELRPLNEFSAARQEALNEALVTVGVDPRELTEADEFFGTAALKSYNTFVRPRPKQLAKVMQEPVARAALRTASQVAFLVRRHRADRAEYLRNKDASMTEAERRGLVAHPVALVCDNVRSAYNVGSIFSRSADTARVAEVITCGFTPHPGGHGEDKVRKTGFGSVDAVAHRHFEDPSEAVRSLKAAGAFVCALETTDNASSLFDVRFPLPRAPEGKARPKNASALDAGTTGGGDVVRGSFAAEDSENEARALTTDGGAEERLDEGSKGGLELEEGGVVALVLGNEVTGVDERVLGLCDLVVEVPVFGLKNSLNVASAGTVVLYEVLRQWSVAGRLAGSGD
ncbi:unnamed protein product [Ectocarpus sp. 4 AP-2014]